MWSEGQRARTDEAAARSRALSYVVEHDVAGVRVCVERARLEDGEAVDVVEELHQARALRVSEARVSSGGERSGRNGEGGLTFGGTRDGSASILP